MSLSSSLGYSHMLCGSLHSLTTSSFPFTSWSCSSFAASWQSKHATSCSSRPSTASCHHKDPNSSSSRLSFAASWDPKRPGSPAKKLRSLHPLPNRKQVARRLHAPRPEAGAQEAPSTAPSDRLVPLPTSPEEQVEQARVACRRAIADGCKRLQLELLLPIIGASQLDDWPGGIRQQYQAAAPMVKALMKGVLEGRDRKGALTPRVLDEDDAVAAWECEELALVLFPTAETLGEVERIAGEGAGRPAVLVNAQWQGGQVVSDFGWGGQRERAESFVRSFVPVYSLRQLRLRSEDVRVLRCYPTGWQVFVVDSEGSARVVTTVAESPSYRQLEDILREARKKAGGEGDSWLGRMMAELRFNQDSLK